MPLLDGGKLLDQIFFACSLALLVVIILEFKVFLLKLIKEFSFVSEGSVDELGALIVVDRLHELLDHGFLVSPRYLGSSL